MHTFYTLNGAVQVERFMQAPKLADGKVWVSHRPNHWTEECSPHGPESDPNHSCYDMYLFGEHHETFMRRQYK